MSALDAALPVGRALRATAAAAFALALVAGTAAAVAALGRDPGRPDLFDFHELYLAGRLAAEGRLAAAYDPAAMAALQSGWGGRDLFLPFGYPPAMALVLAPVARLPVAAAFALFGTATLGLYLAGLRRVAGAAFWPALLAATPAVLIDLKIGQTGLLTGGLAALSLAALLEGRPAASGLAAGALAALKPHLALALPVLFLARGRRALPVAGLAGAALCGVALAAFGAAAGPAFLGSLGVAGRFMAEGAFPVHRMASLYAAALSLGVPPGPALALHALAAAAVLGAALAPGARLDPRPAAGLVVMAGAFASPYLYDYDLTGFALGFALALPELSRRLSRRRLAALAGAVAAATSLGLLATALAGALPAAASLSAMGPALLACYAACAAALGRRVAPLTPAPA